MAYSDSDSESSCVPELVESSGNSSNSDSEDLFSLDRSPSDEEEYAHVGTMVLNELENVERTEDIQLKIAHANKAVKLDPKCTKGFKILAECYVQSGDPSDYFKAKDAIEKSILHCGQVDSHYHTSLGELQVFILNKLSLETEAIAVAEVYSKHPSVIDRVVPILLKKHDYDHKLFKQPMSSYDRLLYQYVISTKKLDVVINVNNTPNELKGLLVKAYFSNTYVPHCLKHQDIDIPAGVSDDETDNMYLKAKIYLNDSRPNGKGANSAWSANPDALKWLKECSLQGSSYPKPSENSLMLLLTQGFVLVVMKKKKKKKSKSSLVYCTLDQTKKKNEPGGLIEIRELNKDTQREDPRSLSYDDVESVPYWGLLLEHFRGQLELFKKQYCPEHRPTLCSDPTPSCDSCSKCRSLRYANSICVHCLGESTTQCAKCNAVRYCGRDCQKADWKVHKLLCAEKVVEDPRKLPASKVQKCYRCYRFRSKIQNLMVARRLVLNVVKLQTSVRCCQARSKLQYLREARKVKEEIERNEVEAKKMKVVLFCSKRFRGMKSPDVLALRESRADFLVKWKDTLRCLWKETEGVAKYREPREIKQLNWTSLLQQQNMLITEGTSLHIDAIQSRAEKMTKEEEEAQCIREKAIKREVETELAQERAFDDDFMEEFYAEDEHKEPETLADQVYVQPEREANEDLVNVEYDTDYRNWWMKAEDKIRVMANARILRLIEGDRTYMLAKRLKGSKYHIYEVKLDSGQRILWSRLKQRGSTSLHFWCVTKHDFISANVAKIDASIKKSHTPGEWEVTSDRGYIRLSDDHVLMEPSMNNPLKTYTMSVGDVCDMNTYVWTPQLKLSGVQEMVNTTLGTVTLLGRSGTGKTVCVSDRITRDTFVAVSSKQYITQLFICRSRRLKAWVKDLQDNARTSLNKEFMPTINYQLLDEFVLKMEERVYEEHSEPRPRDLYPPRLKINFQKFSKLFRGMDIKRHGCLLDPLVIWTQIKSFIKGSLEAVRTGRPLTLAAYLDEKTFSPRRVRLTQKQRREVYKVYECYADSKTVDGKPYWDEASRVLEILRISKLEPLDACVLLPMGQFGGNYNKIYVDEVQDNTQSEIMLFFLATGMNTNALFLAGDPAQSVEEGVEFRFEEVRSIVHFLSNGGAKIEHPLKLTVNYRSHRGILNCAGSILEKMTRNFPGAAQELPLDKGVCDGSRPAFYKSTGLSQLLRLLGNNQKIVVICRDKTEDGHDYQAFVQSFLSSQGIHNTVVGICAAKGLEYTDVVLLNFFECLSDVDLKAWKSMLDDNRGGFESTQCPQVEAQLKSLYTAVTRSCNRLIFFETESVALSPARCSAPEDSNTSSSGSGSAASAATGNSDRAAIGGDISNDWKNSLSYKGSVEKSMTLHFFRWLDNNKLAELLLITDEKTFATSDERRLKGVDFMKQGNVDSAIIEFVLADDKKMVKVAKAQQKLVQLDEDLFDVNYQLSSANEVEVCKAIEAALREGLVQEVWSLMQKLDIPQPSLRWFTQFIFKPISKLADN